MWQALILAGLAGCEILRVIDRDFDEDGDGYLVNAKDPQKKDCNDNDPKINPGAVEGLHDGVDQNCNGMNDEDVDGDGVIDSFYVNFNYLRNNAIVNALCAANAASSALDQFLLTVKSEVRALTIKIENPQRAQKFLFGLRRINSSFFDTIVASNLPEVTISGLNPTQYYVSACGVDSLEWYSMFSQEYIARVLNATDDHLNVMPVELIQNKPNPFDELSLIPIIVNDPSFVKTAKLVFTSETGIVYKTIPLNLTEGINEILYDYQWNQYACGTYFYTLFINGKPFATKKMNLLNY